MRDRTAEVLVATTCGLGEGPHWDATHARLHWLDIPARVLHTWSMDRTHTSFELDRLTSFVAPTATGGLVAAGEDRVRLLDACGGERRVLATLPADPGTRTNDGACDPQGRLWIGTADEDPDRDAGCLYRVDGQGQVETLRTGISMSNGIDWSPDGRIAYHVDTRPGRIDRLELDDRGDITTIDTFVTTDLMPDGLAVDADGGLWVAFWDGGMVRRYTPDGVVDDVIRVDGGHITSCAFGGPDGTQLFITTARQGLSQPQLAASPGAGALFVIDVGIGGRGVNAFRQQDPPG